MVERLLLGTDLLGNALRFGFLTLLTCWGLRNRIVGLAGSLRAVRVPSKPRLIACIVASQLICLGSYHITLYWRPTSSWPRFASFLLSAIVVNLTVMIVVYGLSQVLDRGKAIAVVTSRYKDPMSWPQSRVNIFKERGRDATFISVPIYQAFTLIQMVAVTFALVGRIVTA